MGLTPTSSETRESQETHSSSTPVTKKTNVHVNVQVFGERSLLVIALVFATQAGFWQSVKLLVSGKRF